METTELAALVISLNLGVAEPESKLDLTVLEGNDPEAIKNLAHNWDCRKMRVRPYPGSVEN